MKFFSPTNKLKELRLLQHIEKKSETTQKEIAMVIEAAPSMVNVYIDELEKKQYMIRDYKSPKVVRYNITKEGIKRKNYLAITYFHELLEHYRTAEETIEKFLKKLENKGYKNVLIYGAGEVSETILGVIKCRTNIDLNILALIDDDESRQNEQIEGYTIISRDEISEYIHDGIIIASYTFEDDITNRLKEIGYPQGKIERFFTS